MRFAACCWWWCFNYYCTDSAHDDGASIRISACMLGTFDSLRRLYIYILYTPEWDALMNYTVSCTSNQHRFQAYNPHQSARPRGMLWNWKRHKHAIYTLDARMKTKAWASRTGVLLTRRNSLYTLHNRWKHVKCAMGTYMIWTMTEQSI